MTEFKKDNSVGVNINRELHEHFIKVRDLRDDILLDGENTERISAMKAMTFVIKDLSKLQQQVYNTEKLAILQSAIVEVLQEYDPIIRQEVQDAFYKKLTRLEQWNS